ncbi:putative acyl esterase [Coniochaeta sp. 2T2.1]|nr:putative acyl esterase [Coniochaeta sp. 2T2.1]
MGLPAIKDAHQVDTTSFDYVYEENVAINLAGDKGIVRCNVYRPKDNGDGRFPVLVTYGPYGKDVHYSVFHAESFSEVPEEHHSPHSSWETPDPGFWTRNGYAVVRADEVGTGQSPGILDTMSRNTSRAFFDVVEWAASQPWSSGKVGLLGISYFAGSQWRVAALQPKGLACIVPWEGMSDYYRDRCRHGGILSNTFINFWWNRQVVTNQYGRPGRAARKWGHDTIEGDLSEEKLVTNRRDQNKDNAAYRFLDAEYYASKDYNMADIKVPVLSVANWGGILLHLRGNVEGYLNAGSQHKYLRLITGRHDLPFYEQENVEMQKSFLDAFLKGEDRGGWWTGQAPKVGLVLREGNVGYNDSLAEKQYPHRFEQEWPIARTKYTKYFLTADKQLTETLGSQESAAVSYQAPSNLKAPKLVQFVTQPFRSTTEITGHIVVHLNVSVTPLEHSKNTPSEIDLFITLRHLDAHGTEILYTGTVGDPVPVTKGWLRVSHRKVAVDHPRHREWAPYRTYSSTDVLPVKVGEVYPVDVEVWPTNVVVGQSHRLVLEVSSGDTLGAGLFEHASEVDRPRELLEGWNNIHFGERRENWHCTQFIVVTMSSEPERLSTLRPHNRFITTHDISGKAVFSNAIPEPAPVRRVMGGDMEFSLMYATEGFPISMAGNKDMETYYNYIINAPKIVIPGGTVCRSVDFPPGYTSPMHRTVSIDFGVVIEGEVELVLDSSETRLLKPGDVAVQRGTNHAWRNTSETGWARMLYVLQSAEKLVVTGKELGEDEGGID